MSARMSSASRVIAPSDTIILAGIAWDRSAPSDLVIAASVGDTARFAARYREWLRKQLVNARTTPSPLLIGWSLGGDDTELARQVAAMNVLDPRKRSRRTAIKSSSPWTEHAKAVIAALLGNEAAELQTPVGLLTALELLAMGATRIPVEEWWSLWTAALSAVRQRQSAAPVEAQTPDEVLIACGELPLLIGYVFAPILGMNDQARTGRRFLSRVLIAETDTDGTPAASLLARLPRWLAPIVRSSIWARRFDRPLWTPEQQRRFNDLLERSVALSRADGRLALANGLPSEPFALMQTAADLLDWSTRHPGRNLLRSVEKVKATPKLLSKLRQPSVAVMPSNQSDWARFALLRTDWSASAASVAIAHHGSLPELDITLEGQSVVHGPWGLDLQLGDAGVQLADEWACVCWESDPDADYAELQMTGPGRLRVERMVLLSRQDRFLLMADAISGAPAGRLRYRSRLPLVPGVTTNWVAGRRELQVTAGRCRARILPLALPEDTTLSSPHRFEVSEGQLVLDQTVDGQGLLAPVIIDWHPERRSAEALWRRLTVTEAGRVVNPDAASAYRWQIGKQQWLLLRSLKPAKVPRAVLGHHTANETVIGRFDKAGVVETVLAIEPQ